MTGPIEYLDLDDVVALATRLLGDPPPVRDMGLLAAAVARPQATAFGEDAYPDTWTKAAALFQSIVSNDALIDGNKRLGCLSYSVFLRLNGMSAEQAENNDVVELVLAVATGESDVDAIAAELRRIIERAPGD